MKNKLLCLLLCLTVLLSVGIPAANAEHTYTVAEADSLCDGIVDFIDGVSAQHFIDNGLRDNAGVSAEFYVIALSQRGSFDFSAYEKALLQYLDTHEIYSATTREKYALALIASGSTNSYIAATADEAIGGQGVMSLVFGLHILNNGYHSALYSADELVDTILGCQLSDGGWAVIGDRGDADVTAMTLQALAPYYRSRGRVQSSIDRALTLLSKIQQPDGGYITMGAENCESAAQVLIALSDLGVDANSDPRFIKNGKSVLDAMLGYRNSDGSFAHTGSGFNETATMEAFCALTAYRRFMCGQGPLYVLDNRRPASVESPRQSGTEPRDTSHSPDRSGGSQSGVSRQDPDAQNTGDDPPQYGGDDDGSNGDAGGGIVYVNGQPQTRATGSPSSNQKETVAAKAVQTVPPTDTPTQKPTERDAGRGAGVFQPTASAPQPSTADESAPAEKGAYKPYAIACIIAAALIAALILFLLKKRSKKHYIAVAILAAIGVLFILLTNFESRESYQTAPEKTDTTGCVTITVRCDTLKDDKKPSNIPDDCVILEATTFAIADGDTVYHILLEASKRCNFQIDNRGAAGSAYIAGIEYLYEFDYGDLSGWMYRVNGEFPDVGCQSYELHDGDEIEWLYTKNIGKDL